jgi:predicted DNA-binding transcriptional regulator AlpA
MPNTDSWRSITETGAETHKASPGGGAPLPRLVLWKRDVCQVLGVGTRTLERMISSGEVPAPDRRLRGRPAWLARTIHEWAERGCPGGRQDFR